MIEVLPPFLVYVICCYALEYKQPKIQRSSCVALSVSNLLLGCITAAIATRFFDLTKFTSIPQEFLALVMMGFIGDTLFYWSHRLLHMPFFFQRYHALHHTHVNPISWTALYVHPGEFIIAMAAVFLIPVACVRAYWITVTLYWSFVMFSLVISHAASEHHEAHHLTPKGNFGSRFGIWDKLMRTNL